MAKDNKQNNKYNANVDYLNLYSTIKKYIGDKFSTVTAGIRNSKGEGHRVLVCGCYKINVKANIKLSNKIMTGTKDYYVLKVCDGWTDSWKNGSWSSSRSYKYIFLDCVNDIIKLK